MDAVDWLVLVVAGLSLFAGGFVKGAVGFGLPLTAVPLMAFVMPPPTAIALMAAPILISNLVQMFQGGASDGDGESDGGLPASLRRIWPLLLTLSVGILIGSRLLVSVDEARLALVLGLTVLGLSVSQLMGLSPPGPSRRAEPYVSAMVGAVAGLIGGVSSMFGPVVIVYLVALRLPKHEFVRTIATIYMAGGVLFFGALAGYGVLTRDEMLGSLAACVPVGLGLLGGAALRRWISPDRFRRLVLIGLGAVGLAMISRAAKELLGAAEA